LLAKIFEVFSANHTVNCCLRQVLFCIFAKTVLPCISSGSNMLGLPDSAISLDQPVLFQTKTLWLFFRKEKQEGKSSEILARSRHCESIADLGFRIWDLFQSEIRNPKSPIGLSQETLPEVF